MTSLNRIGRSPHELVFFTCGHPKVELEPFQFSITPMSTHYLTPLAALFLPSLLHIEALSWRIDRPLLTSASAGSILGTSKARTNPVPRMVKGPRLVCNTSWILGRLSLPLAWITSRPIHESLRNTCREMFCEIVAICDRWVMAPTHPRGKAREGCRRCAATGRMRWPSDLA